MSLINDTPTVVAGMPEDPKIETDAYDYIYHPKHYTSHPSSMECIEIVRHHNFNIGSAIKYLWRQGLKPGEESVKDLKKAIWYIEDEIKKLEKK